MVAKMKNTQLTNVSTKAVYMRTGSQQLLHVLLTYIHVLYTQILPAKEKNISIFYSYKIGFFFLFKIIPNIKLVLCNCAVRLVIKYFEKYEVFSFQSFRVFNPTAFRTTKTL